MQDEVLKFWFEECDQKQWWQKDPAFDELIARRFAALHAQAAACELYPWRETAQGRLAEIIVLDQFSRNLFRDQAAAFACDSLALALTQEAIAAGHDEALATIRRKFLYMPFMHSESRLIHAQAETLFARHLTEDDLDFERRHKAIVDRFGRYPHRNEVLGRASTPEELAFLREPGSSF